MGEGKLGGGTPSLREGSRTPLSALPTPSHRRKNRVHKCQSNAGCLLLSCGGRHTLNRCIQCRCVCPDVESSKKNTGLDQHSSLAGVRGPMNLAPSSQNQPQASTGRRGGGRTGTLFLKGRNLLSALSPPSHRRKIRRG